ncbi:MAG: lytic transglycosylase domain-containing protein [Pseudomonadota bacterium]
MRKVGPGHSRRRAMITTTLVLILCTPITVTPSAVIAQDRTAPASEQHSIDIHIADAERRFGIPQPWIRAVMEVESAGNPRAVSHAGAMGLMQIMPSTWAELRAAYFLGDDPFDSRDNILAGAAYLRQMYDRFGSPGFLAAYNAGPGRYAEHLATGRPLPRETRAYVATLAPIISGEAPDLYPPVTHTSAPDWRDAPLFAGGPGLHSGDNGGRRTNGTSTAVRGLFVTLWTGRTP